MCVSCRLSNFTAALGFSLVFIMVGESFDPLQASILGWTGWLVPLVLVIVLLATGQFRPAPPQPVVTRNESAPVAGAE